MRLVCWFTEELSLVLGSAFSLAFGSALAKNF